MSDYKTLKGMTLLIQTKEIRDFVDSFLNENVPEYFQTIPASSTGKYHPAYSLGEGGLVRHTIATVKLLHHMTNLDFIKERFQQVEIDKMIAAAILHDTFKQGLNSYGHSVKNHEVVAAEQINEALSMEDAEISRLVSTHMGQWGAKHPSQLDEFLVHLADYLASRKNIAVDVS